MPNIDFVLPHAAYWAVLGLFPLLVFLLIRHERHRAARPRVSLPLAYLFWLCAGFAGMHRFYLRSAWGMIFIPVFLAMLWLNTQAREAREGVSATRQAMDSAQFTLNRAKSAAQRGGAPVAPEVEAKAADTRAAFGAAEAVRRDWENKTRMAAMLLGGMLLVDAALLPRAVRRRDKRERDTREPPPEIGQDERVGAVCAEVPAGARVRGFVYAVDQISRYTGRFVAYWSVLAVFAYYYEVLGRYVFNSPTNWVHESQFLMFGMMYMMAGAYAFRDDSHVRVDVVYTHFSRRGKALADVISSVFFFVFTLTLLWTGWRFAADALAVRETSFSEWGIQYWPVKLAMPAGAALLVLQGVARLAKDLAILTEKD